MKNNVFQKNVGEKAPDDFADDYIYRKIAHILVVILMKTPIKPNHVTIFNIFLTFVAFAVIYFENGVIFHPLISGAVLLFICLTLDCVDGQLAREKNMVSDLGKTLDILQDHILAVGSTLIVFEHFHAHFSFIWIIILICGVGATLHMYAHDFIKDEFLLHTKKGYVDMQKNYIFHTRKNYDALRNGTLSVYDESKAAAYAKNNHLLMRLWSFFGYAMIMTVLGIGLILCAIIDYMIFPYYITSVFVVTYNVFFIILCVYTLRTKKIVAYTD